MTTRRKRVKAGDVLELKIGKRFAYLHFIGKHREYGDAIVVNSRLQEQRTLVSSDYFADGYLTFYPVIAAIAHGLVEVVTHLPIAAIWNHEYLVRRVAEGWHPTEAGRET